VSCPICGARIDKYEKHRCKESVLRAIDAARDRRDPDCVQDRRKPIGQRIADGSFMLAMGEDDIDDE
jgi:hypothetical protein